MKEGIIFLEKSFWMGMTSEREKYLLVDKIIRSHSDIYTDFQKNDIGETPALYDVFSETGGRIYWDKNVDDYIDSDDIRCLSSFFLVDKDSMYCDGKSVSRGIVVMNNSQYKKPNTFFEQTTREIDEGRKYYQGWKNKSFESIFSNKYCNALIINDKYLCNKGYINPELLDILDLLLPRKIDMTFHLSIFSEINTNGESIYMELRSTIKSIRSDEFERNTQLTLCYSTLHDRFILSNTFLITVGAGFKLFSDKYGNPSNKPSNSTAIKVLFPVACGTKSEYNLFIRKTNDINNGTINYWGDKENRLFDLVKS